MSQAELATSAPGTVFLMSQFFALMSHLQSFQCLFTLVWHAAGGATVGRSGSWSKRQLVDLLLLLVLGRLYTTLSMELPNVSTKLYIVYQEPLV